MISISKVLSTEEDLTTEESSVKNTLEKLSNETEEAEVLSPAQELLRAAELAGLLLYFLSLRNICWSIDVRLPVRTQTIVVQHLMLFIIMHSKINTFQFYY